MEACNSDEESKKLGLQIWTLKITEFHLQLQWYFVTFNIKKQRENFEDWVKSCMWQYSFSKIEGQIVFCSFLGRQTGLRRKILISELGDVGLASPLKNYRTMGK